MLLCSTISQASLWPIMALLLLCHAALQPTTGQAASGIEEYENYFNEIELEDKDAEVKTRNALKSPLQRWPTHNLYYRISKDYTPQEADNVRSAVGVFNERTCLTFREYDEQRDGRGRRYIYYKKAADVCGTRVGYNPLSLGSHDVVLNPYCLSQVAVIQHETMHVLGLYHEQSRPDRDKYIQIEYDNIPNRYWSQFIAYPELYTTTFNVPYDYESLMHYSQFAFAKDTSKPSMRARNGDDVFDRNMGQLRGPSDGDLTKINMMYKCN